jgi:hypothetical protein
MTNMTNAFFSGFMPVGAAGVGANTSAAAAPQVLTYTIRVMDTKPVWYYCSQAKHCQGGMVGAINAYVSLVPCVLQFVYFILTKPVLPVVTRP